MARTLGDLVAVIGADTTAFESAMNGISNQMNGVKTNLQTAGAQIAQSTTAPFQALGTTAEKSAQQVSAAATTIGTVSQKAAQGVTELGNAQKSAGAAIQATVAPLQQAGEKASVMGGLFEGLKNKAVELVPGLGSVLSMAGGVATGMAGLQIAEKVGSWLLDVGGKALTASGQLGKITELAGNVQGALEGLVGKGIQLLASAISATIGPAIEQLISWITTGLQYLTAFGDWFKNQGALELFGAAVSGITALFAPLVEAIERYWKAVSDAFGGFGNLFGDAESRTNIFLTVLKGIFEALVAVVSLAIALIKQQFTLFVDALTWVANLLADWVPRIINFVKSLYTGVVAWVSQIAGGIQSTFAVILEPIEAVFQKLWDVIKGWATDVLSFLGKFIGSIPGLQSFAKSFTDINNTLLNFGQHALTGTAAQKQLNDQTEAAAKKAQALADAEKALGVTVVDANAAVAQSTTAMSNWQTVIANVSAPSQLATATINAFNQIAASRKAIEETGTAAQKSALDTQLKQLTDYAAAHGIQLQKVTDANKKAIDDNSKLAATALQDLLKSIGYVSEAQTSFNVTHMQQGYEAALKLMQGNTAEFAQVVTRTYDQIQAARKDAADRGYTAEVTRLDQLSANVKQMAEDHNIALQSEVKMFQSVADAIAKIPPQITLADQAIAGMGAATQHAMDQANGAINSLKFTSDAAANEMIRNITNSYLAQVQIAGTSEAEKVRLAKEGYAELTTMLQQYGAGVDAATAAQVQTAIQSQMQITKDAGAQLTERTAATKASLDQQSGFWDAFDSNISKGMKKAAGDITDALWSGDKSFGQIALQTLEDIGKGLTKTFVQTGLDAVGKFVSGALKSLLEGDGSLAGALTGIGKKISGLFSGGGGAGGALAGPGFAAPGGGGGAASGVGSGLSGAMGIVTGVSSAISAVTGIISLFQARGTQKIEENMQNGIFLTYYAVWAIQQESISYFHWIENRFGPYMMTRIDDLIGAVKALPHTAGGTSNTYNLTVNASGGSLDSLIRTLQAQGFVLT